MRRIEFGTDEWAVETADRGLGNSIEAAEEYERKGWIKKAREATDIYSSFLKESNGNAIIEKDGMTFGLLCTYKKGDRKSAMPKVVQLL